MSSSSSSSSAVACTAATPAASARCLFNAIIKRGDLERLERLDNDDPVVGPTTLTELIGAFVCLGRKSSPQIGKITGVTSIFGRQNYITRSYEVLLDDGTWLLEVSSKEILDDLPSIDSLKLLIEMCSKPPTLEDLSNAMIVKARVCRDDFTEQTAYDPPTSAEVSRVLVTRELIRDKIGAAADGLDKTALFDSTFKGCLCLLSMSTPRLACLVSLLPDNKHMIVELCPRDTLLKSSWKMSIVKLNRISNYSCLSAMQAMDDFNVDFTKINETVFKRAQNAYACATTKIAELCSAMSTLTQSPPQEAEPPRRPAPEAAVTLACRECLAPIDQPEVSPPPGWSGMCDDCCCGQCGSRRKWDAEYESFYCCSEFVGGGVVDLSTGAPPLPPATLDRPRRPRRAKTCTASSSTKRVLRSAVNTTRSGKRRHF